MLKPPLELTLPEAQKRVTELYGRFQASKSDVDRYEYMTAITDLHYRVQQESLAQQNSYNAPPTVPIPRQDASRAEYVQSHQTELALSQLAESIRQRSVQNGVMFRQLGQAMLRQCGSAQTCTTHWAATINCRFQQQRCKNGSIRRWHGIDDANNANVTETNWSEIANVWWFCRPANVDVQLQNEIGA